MRLCADVGSFARGFPRSRWRIRRAREKRGKADADASSPGGGGWRRWRYSGTDANDRE